MAGEGNHHQVRRGLTGGHYTVKLVGFVENHLPLLQQVRLRPAGPHFTFVHAEKFPEIVGLPFEGEIVLYSK